MQAQGIRKGDRYEHRDDMGRVAPSRSWEAAADAVVAGDDVRVAMVGCWTAVWRYNQQIDLTWGAGQ